MTKNYFDLDYIHELFDDVHKEIYDINEHLIILIDKRLELEKLVKANAEAANYNVKAYHEFVDETIEAVNNINGATTFTNNRLTALTSILEEKGIIGKYDIRDELQKQAERRKK